MTDTIFAVSSGAPPAAIAILRVSGARAFETVRALSGRLPEPRRAALRRLRDPASGEAIDRGLVLLFPGSGSATGEDLAELHLHGGRAVIRAMERVLAGQPGLRAAEPGEFTRRALANGRIDLVEAEGLADVLAAETERQRRAAIGAAEGTVSRRIGEWSARVLGLAAEVEAAIDFDDEDDVAAPVGLGERLAALAGELEAAVSGPSSERLRDGVRIVLAGPPNAGKSSLFNVMCGREAAIVSPIAGTTRDRIEAPVMRGGIPYLLIDTAGLAEASADPIERIGIGRAQAAMAEADLVLWLGDEAPPDGALWVHARADLPERTVAPVGSDVSVSAATGRGVEELWSAIAARAEMLIPRPDALAWSARQQRLVSECVSELRQASAAPDLLIAAEHLRGARISLDRLVGKLDVEAMLDALFGRFCIGK